MVQGGKKNGVRGGGTPVRENQMRNMDERTKQIDADDFRKGIFLTTEETFLRQGEVKWIALTLRIAFATTITSDLDYFLEPQWADDEDIKEPLRNAVSSTGKALDFVDGWANDDMAFFISYRSRQLLFEEAKKQNIVLWEERKLRRIHNGMQDHKRDSDTSDALALLKTESAQWRSAREGVHSDAEYVLHRNVTR
ncbi:hypothetical protein I7I51_01034 [Histoplasma capsulatum]|uniref:Uncharacterized protein n=1 Tax=Ajellomyces capsulatus TaxID=5037 RepID=A0A8A1MH31_AJECA|nr:hypothetical protein I7I51_01034 [Histoplasma capsulatum]